MEFKDLSQFDLQVLNKRLEACVEESQRRLKSDIAFEIKKFLSQAEYYKKIAEDPSKRNRMQEIEWDLSPEAWDAEDPVR